MDGSQAPNIQPRSTSGSVRPHGSRATNPDKQISQIEKSVTHLLVATKQLLETLTQWSRGNAQEEEVSDVYVRLGYEFNLACRAFNSIGVETGDLGPVPDLLRSILEDTLSQPASPQSLDNYLPRIRDIIINLLHGLKKKQSKLRSRSSKDSSSKTPTAPPRQSSIGSVGTSTSTDTGLTSMMDSLPATGTGAGGRSEGGLESINSTEEQTWMPANASASNKMERGSIRRQSARRQNPLTDASAKSSPSYQTLPPVLSPPDSEPKSSTAEVPFPYPPPPPPPKQQDALTALQRGGDLERRASRRFSSIQVSKALGGAANGVPVLPPPQNTPIPNRGREVKESMNAVRSRASLQDARKRSANRLAEMSPDSPVLGRSSSIIQEDKEEFIDEIKTEPPKIETPAHIATTVPESPTIGVVDNFEPPKITINTTNGLPEFGATVSGPLSAAPEEFRVKPGTPSTGSRSPEVRPIEPEVIQAVSQEDRTQTATTPTKEFGIVNGVDSSPPHDKALTLFLQYRTKVKKFVLPGGYEDLTMARLQLAFIEKFNWNTHNNGVDLPEIYLQDQVSGVRYEIDDLSDIKDRSVLVLNIEVLDEVKKHFDEGLGGLKMTLEGVRSLLDGQGSMMQRFSDRQLEASKEMARLSATPTPRSLRSQDRAISPGGSKGPSKEASMAEVQNLRRDIAVLKQTYSTMASDFAATMKDIKAKADNVKAAASEAAVPSFEGDAGRAHVNQGKSTLNSESEALVNRVDDLSDAVEELRKDVVSRGVRPLPRQLEDISREIVAATKDFMKTKDFLKREKPVWTKVWEKELDQVCTEREDLTQREELMADMEMDLEEVTSVFKLVEEATKQQNLQAPGQAGLRSVSKALDIDPTIDPREAKDSVLDEVKALNPNHESRLEAIERAEKARFKELETRKVGPFQREVAEFVEEGKLKKTGGMEEVERLRKIKDERARKENFETQQQQAADRARKRAEKEAAKAAAVAAAAAAPTTPADGAAEDTNMDGTGMERDVETAEHDQSNEAATETPYLEPSASEVVHDSSQSELIFQDAPEDAPLFSPMQASNNAEPAPLQISHSRSQSDLAVNQQEHDVRRSKTPPAEEQKEEPDLRESTLPIESAEKGKSPEIPALPVADRSSWFKPAFF